MGAARYKPYPAYKPSYAAWSGDVPDHWSPIRLKHVFAEKKKVHNPALPAGSISFGNVIYKNEESLAKETKAAYQELRCGEFLINPLNMNYDLLSLRTALSSIDVVVSTGYMILQSVEGYDKNYLRWLLQQFDVAHMKTLGAGVRQTISYADIGNSFICEPPLPEQTKIAAFLDYETGKIDALIAKQERLIALLEEKRQAVISYAVTKGLNPTAPLRPSGIDWLGDVPAHWITSSLKFQTEEMQTGPFGSQLHSEDYISGGIPLVNPAHMIKGRIIPDTEVTVDQATAKRLHRHKLNDGDLIFARRGELGRCAIVTSKEIGWLCGTGSLKAALKSSLNPAYAYLLITSKGVTSEMSLESKGSTMENLNTETLGNIRLPIPPIDEQLDILSEVEKVTSIYDELVGNANNAATLLKERRTALISAAVTGKIDVRDWQPPQPLSDTDLSTETLQEAAL